MLPLLEQSAMRLGGFATKADLIKAKQRLGSEFRFEAMSHPGWMGKARHLSFHGTGRAMDFRAGANPAFGGPTHQLVSILGEGELSELEAGSTQQRQDLQRVATHNADVLRLRGSCRAAGRRNRRRGEGGCGATSNGSTHTCGTRCRPTGPPSGCGAARPGPTSR